MRKANFLKSLRTAAMATIGFLTFISAVGSGLLSGCTQSDYYRTLYHHEKQVKRRLQQRRADTYWPQRPPTGRRRN